MKASSGNPWSSPRWGALVCALLAFAFHVNSFENQFAFAPIALVGGLIFAVHPVHVEAVSSIVGIAEVQAAILFLWACLLHARAAPALTPPTEEGAHPYGTKRLVAVTLLYLGAFFTKE